MVVLRLSIDQLTVVINAPAITGVTGSRGQEREKVVLANQHVTDGHERFYKADDLTVLLVFGCSYLSCNKLLYLTSSRSSKQVIEKLLV